MKAPISLLLTCTCVVMALPPPHPEVLAVRQQELSLPDHLRKPALRNPHLRNVLELTSLLHHGEQPVFERQADKVDRSEIYKMLIHAGFVSRRHRPEYPPHNDHNQFQNNNYHNPEHLQYL